MAWQGFYVWRNQCHELLTNNATSGVTETGAGKHPGKNMHLTCKTKIRTWKWRSFDFRSLLIYPGPRGFFEFSSFREAENTRVANPRSSLMQRTKGSCKLRVDAGGEDWGHWKNLLEIRFAKETTCLLFSMSDFPQFIITFICCVKQMK